MGSLPGGQMRQRWPAITRRPIWDHRAEEATRAPGRQGCRHSDVDGGRIEGLLSNDFTMRGRSSRTGRTLTLAERRWALPQIFACLDWAEQGRVYSQAGGKVMVKLTD